MWAERNMIERLARAAAHNAARAKSIGAAFAWIHASASFMTAWNRYPLYGHPESLVEAYHHARMAMLFEEELLRAVEAQGG